MADLEMQRNGILSVLKQKLLGEGGKPLSNTAIRSNLILAITGKSGTYDITESEITKFVAALDGDQIKEIADVKDSKLLASRIRTGSAFKKKPAGDAKSAKEKFAEKLNGLELDDIKAQLKDYDISAVSDLKGKAIESLKAIEDSKITEITAEEEIWKLIADGMKLDKAKSAKKPPEGRLDQFNRILGEQGCDWTFANEAICDDYGITDGMTDEQVEEIIKNNYKLLAKATLMHLSAETSKDGKDVSLIWRSGDIGKITDEAALEKLFKAKTAREFKTTFYEAIAKLPVSEVEVKKAKIKEVHDWLESAAGKAFVNSKASKKFKNFIKNQILAYTDAITESELNKITDADLDALSQAIEEYRNNSLHARIKGLNAELSDGEIDGLIVRSGKSVADLESANDETLKTTLLDARRDVEIEQRYAELVDTQDGKNKFAGTYDNDTLTAFKKQAEKLAGLEERVEKLSVEKPTYTKPTSTDDINASLEVFEQEVSAAELKQSVNDIKERLGAGATHVVYVKDGVLLEIELDKLDELDDATDKVKEINGALDEIERAQSEKDDIKKKKGKKAEEKPKKLPDDKRVVEYVKTHSEEIVDAILTKLGKSREKDDLFVKMLTTFVQDGTEKFVFDEDGKIVLDDQALLQIAVNKVEGEWRKPRLELLQKISGLKDDDTIKIGGADVKVKDLQLEQIEEYITKLDELYKTLGIERGVFDDKIVSVKLDEIDSLAKILQKGQPFAGNKNVVLRVFLEFGFSADAAKQIIEDADGLAVEAGITATANDGAIRAALEQNSGILKFKTSGSTDVVDFYTNQATEKEQKQESLKSLYQAEQKTRTDAGVEGIVDKLVGKKGDAANPRKASGDEIDISSVEAELDSLDDDALTTLIEELVSKGLNKEEAKAKLEMLKAAKKYREVLKNKDDSLTGVDARKQNDDIEKARKEATAAMGKYLLITELQDLASEIQKAIDKDNLGKFTTEDLINSNKDDIRTRLEDLRKKIDAFNEKIEDLKLLLGSEVVDKLLSEDNERVKKAQERDEELAPKVETNEERLKRQADEADEELGTEQRFSIESYKQVLQDTASASSHKATIEPDVTALIGDNENTNYIAAYNNKYGNGGKRNAYKDTIEGMTRNGGIDYLLEAGALTQAWLNRYAASLAMAITTLIKSVSTKETLDEEDRANYAHIMIMVEINSLKLNEAIEKALDPNIYKEFVKLFRKMDKGGLADPLYSAENEVTIRSHLLDDFLKDIAADRMAAAKVEASNLVNELISNRRLSLFVSTGENGELIFNDRIVSSVNDALKAGQDAKAILAVIVKGPSL